MATILETGNHISHHTDGHVRRKWSEEFVSDVRKTIRGDAPWKPCAFPTLVSIETWLAEFPSYATKEIGFADLSIIKDWEKARQDYPGYRVRIWSLDRHLVGYDGKGKV
ncbi:MAG: hypothetical protein HQL66_07340 [Magnetococcales bacterium]|nr:hypothetical protein [Magnetococcales bacterium]